MGYSTVFDTICSSSKEEINNLKRYTSITEALHVHSQTFV